MSALDLWVMVAGYISCAVTGFLIGRNALKASSFEHGKKVVQLLGQLNWSAP